jgi:hypothetical protein
MQKKLKLNIQLFGASASASASLTSSAGNKATLSTSFTENSTNIGSNISNISCYASITMNTGAFSGISSPMLYLYWHDNHGNSDVLVASQNVTSLSRNQTVSISGNFNVAHNNDGTLYGYCFASWSYGASSSYVPRSGSAYTANTRLTDIPRATNAPSISGYVGQGTAINLSRYSSSFTHTLRYSFGNLSGTIANGVATNYTWTMPTSFYAQIGNAKSRTGTLYVDTYNGGTLIGTKSATFTANVNESLAKLRVTISSVVDTDNSIISLTGSSSKLVANASDAKVTFTISSPSNATVSSLRVNNAGITASLRQYTISNITTKTITVSATDSRGYVTNATYTIPNAKWIAYVPVSVKGTVARTDGVSGNVHLNFNGNYWTGNFGSANNSLTVQYRYQKEGEDWSSWLPSGGASYTTSGTTYQQENPITISNININNSYNFQIRAIDRINTSGAVYNLVIDRAKPVAWWNNTYFTVNNILRYTTMSQTSLENLKKNFRELGDVMDVVKHFKIYSYNFVDEKDSERRHYGFVIPTNENSPFETPEQVIAKGDEGIDVYAMCSILWRAVQQQQEEIEKLKKKIV